MPKNIFYPKDCAAPIYPARSTAADSYKLGILEEKLVPRDLTGFSPVTELSPDSYAYIQDENGQPKRAKVPLFRGIYVGSDGILVDEANRKISINETYVATKKDIIDLRSVRFKIVDTLPTVGETNVIYFKPTTPGGTIYDEYIYVNNSWKKIDLLDLSAYRKAAAQDIIDATKEDKSNKIDTLTETYFEAESHEVVDSTCTLTHFPVYPGSLTLIKDSAAGANYFDDGNGNIKNTAGTSFGTIEYDSGIITLPTWGGSTISASYLCSNATNVSYMSAKLNKQLLAQKQDKTKIQEAPKGGLSFNDYNTLINYSKNGDVFGANSQIGVKGYHITATNPQSGVATLDITVEETLTADSFSPNDRVYLALDHHSFDEFKVASIDTETKKIYLTLISGTSYNPNHFILDTPAETSVKNYVYGYTYSETTGVYTLLNTGVELDDKTDYIYSFGANNKNAGKYSFVVGKNNFAPSWYNTIFGRDNTGGYGCFVTGAGNKGGNYSITAGQQNNGVASVGAITCGYQNTDKGFYNIVGGLNNTVSGTGNIVSGKGNTLSSADNINTLVIGESNTVGGSTCDSLIVGRGNVCNRIRSVAVGGFNEMGASNSIALGSHLHTTAPYQVVVGRYNSDSDAKFIVGIGSSDDNKLNGFEVYNDGHAEVNAYGTTNKSVVRKQELDTVKQDIDSVKQDIENTKFNLSRNYFYKANPTIITSEYVEISTKYGNLFNITKATVNNPGYDYIKFGTDNLPSSKQMIFSIKYNSFDDTQSTGTACGLVFNIQMDTDKYQFQIRHSGAIFISKNNIAVTGWPTISGGLNTDTIYDVYLTSNPVTPTNIGITIKNRTTGTTLATWNGMDSHDTFNSLGISARYCTAGVNAEIYDLNDYNLRNHN